MKKQLSDDFFLTVNGFCKKKKKRFFSKIAPCKFLVIITILKVLGIVTKKFWL